MIIDPAVRKQSRNQNDFKCREEEFYIFVFGQSNKLIIIGYYEA